MSRVSVNINYNRAQTESLQCLDKEGGMRNHQMVVLIRNQTHILLDNQLMCDNWPVCPVDVANRVWPQIVLKRNYTIAQ